MSSEEHYAFGFSNSLKETFIEMPKEEPPKNSSLISAKCEPFYGYSSENAAKFLSNSVHSVIYRILSMTRESLQRSICI